MVDDKVQVERLDVDNYATWAQDMQALLVMKRLWSTIGGDAPPDAEKDQMARALICLNVAKHHKMAVGKCSTAREAWELLRGKYEAQTTARKLQLRIMLNTVKMGPAEPLTVYQARVQDLKAQLEAVGDTVTDQEAAVPFLCGLPPAYDMIRTVLTAADKPLTIDEMVPKLLPVEQQGRQDQTA